MDRPKREPLICGIDEVGRGPLAGPVTAAAVILPGDFDTTLLRDSKALSEKRRIFLEETILNCDAVHALGWVYPEEIDRINIHNASLLAMQHAFAVLRQQLTAKRAEGDHPEGPLRVIVDGRFCPDLAGISPGVECIALVGADRTVPEVMAASIMAKNARDRLMTDYSVTYDRYGFQRHKGYPTAEHKATLAMYGPTPIHRRTFRGVTVAAVE
jgi:ribonuclease HII